MTSNSSGSSLGASGFAFCDPIEKVPPDRTTSAIPVSTVIFQR